MTTTPRISISAIYQTSTGVRDGIDVDLTVDGVEGSATVAPDTVNGGFAVYGPDVSFWLTGRLVKIYGDDLDAVRAIAAAACQAAESA